MMLLPRLVNGLDDMCDDEFKRIITKRGSGIPTIPASADHRNGDWIDTDIYEGEFYQDTDTGLVYTRNGADITMSDGSLVKDVYKAVISQTGTSDPVIEQELENTLGLTVSTGYITAGAYSISGLDGNAARVVEVTLSGLGVDQEFSSRPTSANAISLNTYVSGVGTDGVLVYEDVTYPRSFNILTITFY